MMKMPKRTLTALKESIEHWQRMSRYKKAEPRKIEEQPGIAGCSLCTVFLRREGKLTCTTCPVKISGHFGCGGTPYVKAYNAYDKHDMPAFRAAARDEVKFLQSLLPEIDKLPKNLVDAANKYLEDYKAEDK